MRRDHRLSTHRTRWKFQGHHTNQSCYKSGIMPIEYSGRELSHSLMLLLMLDPYLTGKQNGIDWVVLRPCHTIGMVTIVRHILALSCGKIR